MSAPTSFVPSPENAGGGAVGFGAAVVVGAGCVVGAGWVVGAGGCLVAAVVGGLVSLVVAAVDPDVVGTATRAEDWSFLSSPPPATAPMLTRTTMTPAVTGTHVRFDQGRFDSTAGAYWVGGLHGGGAGW